MMFYVAVPLIKNETSQPDSDLRNRGGIRRRRTFGHAAFLFWPYPGCATHHSDISLEAEPEEYKVPVGLCARHQALNEVHPVQREEKPFLVRFLRDPLFHFLVAGIVIYAGFEMVSGPNRGIDATSKQIVVTQGEIEWLRSQWASRWGRDPTDQELENLINGHVREIVFYREALELGLDKDDVVIRRRLGQKLEFLSADLLEPEPPADTELRAYFEENAETYRADDRITLTQLFFNPDERGNATVEDAKAVLAGLQAEPEPTFDPSDLGDRFFLPNSFEQITSRELARQFGSGFADSVFGLDPRVWQGPVLSGFGTHLVFIHDYQAAPKPVFEDVSAQVAADWLQEKREELNQEFTDQLIGLYEVTIEQPDTAVTPNDEAIN